MTPARTPPSPDTTGDEDKDNSTASLLFYTTYGGSTLAPEVRLLAALIAATQAPPHPSVNLVADELSAADFSTETYGELFSLIVNRWRAGEMTDPGSLNAFLVDQGASTRRLRELLIDLVAVDVPVYRLPEMAKQVLVSWFHRGFQHAATTIQQIADEAPAHEKFPQLREIGTTQAAADARVRRFHQKLTDVARQDAEAGDAEPASAVLAQRPRLSTDSERNT